MPGLVLLCYFRDRWYQSHYHWLVQIPTYVQTVLVSYLTTLPVIAQLRIYAMYSCNKKLLAVMVAAVALSFGVQGPILLIMVIKAKSIFLLVSDTLPVLNFLLLPAFRLPPVHTGCYAVDPIPYLFPYWLSWVPYLAYESFIFALAIYKSFSLARDQPETPWLVYILLRDSIVFFGGIFSIVLVNCLVNAIGRVCESFIFDPFAQLISDV